MINNKMRKIEIEDLPMFILDVFALSNIGLKDNEYCAVYNIVGKKISKINKSDIARNTLKEWVIGSTKTNPYGETYINIENLSIILDYLSEYYENNILFDIEFSESENDVIVSLSIKRKDNQLPTEIIMSLSDIAESNYSKKFFESELVKDKLLKVYLNIEKFVAKSRGRIKALEDEIDSIYSTIDTLGDFKKFIDKEHGDISLCAKFIDKEDNKDNG